MGTQVRIKASDGHELDLYLAKPQGEPKGAVVICPEIFGVNSHIQAVVKQYAAAGFIAAAPALFDRVQRDYDTGYGPEDIQAGIAVMQKIPMSDAITDTRAAVEHLRKEHDKVSVIGYCWGGTVAWVAASHIPKLAASVVYYPGGLVDNSDIQLHCPVMMHLGEDDQSPSAEDARKVLAEHPTVITYFYEDAGHGFNCDHRDSYQAKAANLSTERTIDYLKLVSERWVG